MLFLFFFLLFPFSSSYNILVFSPLFGHSHTTFLAKIADTLTDAGHNVTFFCPTIMKEFRDIKYVKSTQHVIHMEPSAKLEALGNRVSENKQYWQAEYSIRKFPESFKFFRLINQYTVETLHDNLAVLDEMKKTKYDLMIYEAVFHGGIPVMDYLDIPAFTTALSVTYDSLTAELIGEPTFPGFVPTMMSGFSDKMTFWERYINTVAQYVMNNYFLYADMKSFKPAAYQLDPEDTLRHTSFVFMNSNPYLEFPRPTITKTVQIGGISVDVEKLRSQKLDKKWDTVLTKRKHTVLVSFGSVILSKDMPIEYKIGLTSAMKNMGEVTFIWKYEDDDTIFANNIPNIEFSKWVPQTALLADDRLTAFMTHAGLGSINEVSYLGKPSVICPLFADQMRNAKMLCRHNGSIEISKYDLSNSQLIQNALDTIINDKSYQLSAIKLSKQLNNQPIKPYELLIKHAEFAAQFGRLPSLDPYSRQMSFVQYFLIDVITTTIIIISIIFLIIYQIIRMLVQLVRGTKTKKD